MAEIPKLANLLERDITETKRYLSALMNIINHSRAIDESLRQIYLEMEKKQRTSGISERFLYEIRNRLATARAAERRSLEKLYAVLNLKAIRQATSESTKDLELAYASTNDAKKIFNKIFGR